jgi:1-acyl-sn-glycerol-3-phosphate acyltransferase
VNVVIAWLFERAGWTIEGNLPPDPKYVVIAYPHTTNWDFLIFLAAIGHFRLRVRFLAAAGLFVGPFGWFLTRIGGIPVDPAAPGAVVGAAVDAFSGTDEMVLVMAPEGTRAANSPWRSGFWRIADAAGVPVVMAYVDGPAKRIGFGPAVRVEGDPEAFMEGARAFYADKRGLRPERRGPIELRS